MSQPADHPRQAAAIRTYAGLFALAEFRVLFLNRLLVMASIAMSGLALGTIVYDATGSTVLTALAMFGGPLVTLVGSATVLGASDSVGPRRAMTLTCLVLAVEAAVQSIPGLPWPLRFVLLVIPYAMNAVFGGMVTRLLRGTVSDETFVLGRATLNLAIGVMQVLGYAVGGFLLHHLPSTAVFAVAAVLALGAALVTRFGLRELPATRTRERLVARTHAVNVSLLTSRVTGPIYLASWVPNGLIVGCEALFIPYGGANIAGYLFAATAAGMLLGDVVVGRFASAAWRDRLVDPLRMLLALPYLGFFLDPPVPVAIGLGFVASFGYAAALGLQDRLVRTSDPELTGQVFGLLGNGAMVGQALGALLAGAVAVWVPVTSTMGWLAVASLTVTLALVVPLRSSARAAPVRASGAH